MLAQVRGHATTTIRHPSLRGARLLVVQPLRSLTREPVLALDRLGAGLGDTVLISSDGQYTRQCLNDNTSPARWTIIGIVDTPEVVTPS